MIYTYTPSQEAQALLNQSLPEVELWQTIARENCLEHANTISGESAPYEIVTLNGNHAALHGMRNPSMPDILVAVFKLLVRLRLFESGEKQIALWYAREDNLAPLHPLHHSWFRGFFPQADDLERLKSGEDIGSACIWDFLFLGHVNPSEGWQLSTYLFAHADLSESNRATLRNGLAPVSGFERLAMLYKLDQQAFSDWMVKVVDEIVKNSPEITTNFAKAWSGLDVTASLLKIANLTVWRVGALMWFFNMLAEIHKGANSQGLKDFVENAIRDGEVRLFELDAIEALSNLECVLLSSDLQGEWNSSTRHEVAKIQKALTPQLLEFLTCGALYGNVKAFEIIDLLFSLICVLRAHLIPGLQTQGSALASFIMEGPAFYGYPENLHPHWLNFSTKEFADPTRRVSRKAVISPEE